MAFEAGINLGVCRKPLDEVEIKPIAFRTKMILIVATGLNSLFQRSVFP